MELYWSIGEYISNRIGAAGWGQGTVAELAEHIRRRQPSARGFSASNLWRMMQFFETYRTSPKLATLLRELSWSHNLAILSRCKLDEEREFYPSYFPECPRRIHRPSVRSSSKSHAATTSAGNKINS
ncbi:MAG: DUF1016 N-terminal domain-containing protein [Bacteroidales bacterium]|nr:DUF1016 N-terminal domain-containing protein [Bacteroidales bacterium]